MMIAGIWPRSVQLMYGGGESDESLRYDTSPFKIGVYRKQLRPMNHLADRAVGAFLVFPPVAKPPYIQLGLLSAIAAAWQECCTGLSSDSGRDFQPCCVKNMTQDHTDKTVVM